jgi:hypothetical protein
MCPKRSFGTGMTVLLMIAVSVYLLSCGDIDLDIDQEQTEEPLRFIEFVLFPTAPYVDKSYIEKVPEEELAIKQIDFEAEKKAIREVYSAFIKAYSEKDMEALSKTLDLAVGMEYGTATGTVYGWNDVKIYIQANWEKYDCEGGSNWELIDFYIRPKNVSAFWTEASVKGPMFYYRPGAFDRKLACYNAIGRFYLTKKEDKWRIHQIDGTKYFVDNKYKTP